MDLDEARERLEERFGSREAFLGFQLIQLSMSGQPCDLTFFDRDPMLKVKIDEQLFLAVAYGAGGERLSEMLNNLQLSNGEVISAGEIWTINPMPKGGFTEDELQSVDMSKAEEEMGPDGESLRQMIRETYHCDSRDEENRYIRRWLAS